MLQKVLDLPLGGLKVRNCHSYWPPKAVLQKVLDLPLGGFRMRIISYSFWPPRAVL